MVAFLLRTLGIYVITGYVIQGNVIERNIEYDLNTNATDPFNEPENNTYLQELEKIIHDRTISKNDDFPMDPLYFPPMNYTITVPDFTYHPRSLPIIFIIRLCIYFFLIMNSIYVAYRWTNRKRGRVSSCPTENIQNQTITEVTVVSANAPETPPPGYDTVVVDHLPTYEELMAKKTPTTNNQ